MLIINEPYIIYQSTYDKLKLISMVQQAQPTSQRKSDFVGGTLILGFVIIEGAVSYKTIWKGEQ